MTRERERETLNQRITLMTVRNQYMPVFWIRIGLNRNSDPDPDPGFYMIQYL